MKKVKGSITTNTLVSQISEFSADIVSVLYYISAGPKFGFTFGYGLAFIGSFLLLMRPDDIPMIPFYVTVAKFGVAASFNTVYLASVGLIPTIFSSSVFGFCNVAARIFTIVSPVIAEQDAPLPMLICVTLSIIAAVASQMIVVKLPKF